MNYLKARRGSVSNRVSIASELKRFINLYHISKKAQRGLIYRVSVYFENEYAADIKEQPVIYLNTDDAFRGPEWLVTGGYSRLVHYLARNLKSKIKLKQYVTSIDYSNKDYVAVTTSNGRRYLARKVLITLPAGVLKKDKVKFIPRLPEEKRVALRHITMGAFNKIWLKFPKKFWGNEEFIERLSNAYATKIGFPNKGRYIEFANMHYYLKKPILLVMVTGDFARGIEKQSNSQIIGDIMQVLRSIYGKKARYPVAYKITRWGKDKYTYGAYTSPSLGALSDKRDYKNLARPIDNRVFFAGEATHFRFPGTVHGAYLSGLREAKRILKENYGTVNAINNSVTGISYLNSDDVTTQGKGFWGVFVAPQLTKESGASHVFSLPLTFGYGLNNNTDLNVTLNSYRYNYRRGRTNLGGIGDITLGAKYVEYNLFNQHNDIGGQFNVSLPTGDLSQRATDGAYHFTPSIVAAHNLFLNHWNMQIFTQVGLDLPYRVRNHRNRANNPPLYNGFFLNAATGIGDDHAKITVELNWETSKILHDTGYNEVYVTPAVQYIIGRQWTVGLGAVMPLTRGGNRYTVLGYLGYQVDNLIG